MTTEWWQTRVFLGSLPAPFRERRRRILPSVLGWWEAGNKAIQQLVSSRWTAEKSPWRQSTIFRKITGFIWPSAEISWLLGSMVSTRDFVLNWSIDNKCNSWLVCPNYPMENHRRNCSNEVRRGLHLLLLIVLFKQRIVLPVAHFLHPRCDVGITCPETVKCDREKDENRIHAHSNLYLLHILNNLLQHGSYIALI